MTQIIAGLSLTVAVIFLWRLNIQRERIEAKLGETEARFQTFMDHSPFIASIKDEHGRYVYSNQQLQQHLQATAEQLLGTTAADWLPADVARYIHDSEKRVLTDGTLSEIIEDVPAPDGHCYSWMVMRFPFGEASERRLIGGVSVNITEQISLKRQLAKQLEIAKHLNEELSRANARLNELATTDGLTGLTNYRRFREILDSQFSYARRHHKSLSLLIVDVDCFKQFNDSFGHQEGDEALISVASAIRNVARNYDVVARRGGEEFAILLPDADATIGTLVGHRLRDQIEIQPWPLRPITVSIGVASLTTATRDSKTLLDQADEALYKAKSRGRNCVVLNRQPVYHPIVCSASED